MPRRVQDIVPAGRRSVRETVEQEIEEVRDEKPKRKSSTEKEIPITRIDKPTVKKTPAVTPESKQKKWERSKKWILIMVGIIVLIALAAYIASSFFSRATFTIVPRIVPSSVDSPYVAKPDAMDGSLPYSLVTIHRTASTTIPATDGPQQSTKATGKITLYNAYSATPVRLIAGTRLSSSAGSIYRISSSLVIPGYTTVNGSITPGKVNTTVVADQPGATYNATKADAGQLKIVAYNGGPRYDTVYATAISDFAGGFLGVKKTVNQNVVASTTASMKQSITADLLSQLDGTVPKGYIMYDNSYVTTFSPATVSGNDTNKAVVSMTGTLYGFIFKQTDLVTRLAGAETVASFGGKDFDTVGLDKLDFKIANLKDFNPNKKLTLVIHAKGNIKLVGIIPVDEIKHKLAGSSLANTQDIFHSYNQIIESGSGELVPPWAKIPTDLNRIKVDVQGQ